MSDLELDALDLADLVTDQVRRLGPNSRTKKAIQIFGHIGQQSQTTQFDADTSQLVETEPRRLAEQKTLVALIFQTLGSFAQSAISSVMLWTFALLRWIWKTCTANSVILTFLVLSVTFNMFHTSLGASRWWQERKASNFMARLGVHPNQILSKAVYVDDLAEVIGSSMGLSLADEGAAGACYSNFHAANHLHDLDEPITLSGSGSANEVPARRLQKTRQRLGTYRHDLLVAMRVVDSIEKEAVQAEWEKWVLHENRKCREVGEMLKAAQNNTQGADEGRQKGTAAEVEKWLEGYCGSCVEAREKLVTS